MQFVMTHFAGVESLLHDAHEIAPRLWAHMRDLLDDINEKKEAENRASSTSGCQRAFRKGNIFLRRRWSVGLQGSFSIAGAFRSCMSEILYYPNVDEELSESRAEKAESRKIAWDAVQPGITFFLQ